MKKKVLLILTLLVLLGLGWYMFIWPYQLRVRFTTATLPGGIIQTFKVWEKTLDHSEILEIREDQISQKVLLGDTEYHFVWKFDAKSIDETEVKVLVSQDDNEWRNKMSVPFVKTQIEEDSEAFVRDFFTKINELLNKINVKVKGEVTLQSQFCFCKTLKTTQHGKAGGMMENYAILSDALEFARLKVTGPPLVEVLSWDRKADSLAFDFCFPVQKADSLPPFRDFHYKEIPGQKALAAIYNGNYITSDRAWYALQYYAEQNDYQPTGEPLEIYYSNPNTNRDEKNWKAEVFLPVR